MSAVPSNGHGQAPQIGAAPPHSIEAEQSVLGAVLLWDGALYGLIIEEGLKPEDFYRDRHRLIYESMLALYQESQPVDPLTVTEHLRSRGELESAGGPAEVDALTGAVPAVGNALRYGRIVREHAEGRRLLALGFELQAAAQAHAPADAIRSRALEVLNGAQTGRRLAGRRLDLAHIIATAD